MQDPNTRWVTNNDSYDLDKHKAERAENGFSDYDWWNFSEYIAWVNINALEKFKTGAGFPAELSGMDEWRELLDQMIDGFKAAVEISEGEYFDIHDTKEKNDERYQAAKARQEKGFALYGEYFQSLWD